MVVNLRKTNLKNKHMLTLDKIYHARYVLKDVIRRTDLIQAPNINPDAMVFLKPENLQLTGSFKVRGSYYKISQLSEDEKKKGVIAEGNDADFCIMTKDLEIDTMRASGAGGQHVNKTDSAVRITHLPTGIVVKCQDGRSQHENRATALMQIRAKVYSEMKAKEEAEKNAERKNKLGTGDRSEKIRTYNYPQNRVTDHRIGLTLQQLDRIMEGKLDDVINALLEQDQKDKIAGNV